MSRQFGAGHLMYTLTGVAIAGVTAVAGVTAITNTAANLKPDYSIGVSPTSATVQQGQVASYAVTLTAGTAWNAATQIALSTSSLPKNSSACFVVGTAACAATASATAGTPVTVRVTTNASTPTGSTSFNVDASGAQQKHSVTPTLVVNPASGFGLSLTPSSVSVDQGSTSGVTVAISRTDFTGAVALSSPDLPKGVTATFTPASATGDSSTMTLTASSSAVVGTSPFTVVGTAANQSTQYAGGQITVNGPTKRSFAVSGSVTQLLTPDTSYPIDVTVDNSGNNQDLAVDNLTVTVSAVTQAAGAVGPCTTADFTTVQYSGAYPLTVPSGAARTLSGLSVPSTAWPRIQMLDTGSNQDGCINASITLSYTGTGHGG
jgi:uncharacterized membrane protein